MFTKSIDIERQLTIMQEHGLTAEEWLLAELFMMALDDPSKPEYLSTYLLKCKKDRLGMDTLQSLKDKGVFSSDTVIPKKGDALRLENFELSGTYLNNYFKKALQAGEELWNAYPSVVNINGTLRSINGIIKGGYQHQEDFYAKYNKQIRYSRKKHEEVLDLLKWALEQKLIHYGIVEYVTCKKWEEHARMRESGDMSGYVLRIDTLEDV